MSAVSFLRILPVIFAGFFFPPDKLWFYLTYFFLILQNFIWNFIDQFILRSCSLAMSNIITTQQELASDLKWLSICLSIEVSSLLCCCSVAKSCLTLATPWTIAHQAPLSKGILQARILEWVAIPSSRGSTQPRDWTQVSRTESTFFTVWARIRISSE